MRPHGSPIAQKELLSIIGSIVVSAIAVTAYAFTNFQTKDQSKEDKSSFESRLSRIEGKLDFLIERRE